MLRPAALKATAISSCELPLTILSAAFLAATKVVHENSTNLSLSAGQTGPIAESSGDTILSYVPPHPSKGSRNHRYVTVLLEQSDRISGLQQQVQTNTPFDLRALATQHGLTPVGVHFFRSKWSPVVSTIYADVLSGFFPSLTFAYI